MFCVRESHGNWERGGRGDCPFLCRQMILFSEVQLVLFVGSGDGPFSNRRPSFVWCMRFSSAGDHHSRLLLRLLNWVKIWLIQVVLRHGPTYAHTPEHGQPFIFPSIICIKENGHCMILILYFYMGKTQNFIRLFVIFSAFSLITYNNLFGYFHG